MQGYQMNKYGIKTLRPEKQPISRTTLGCLLFFTLVILVGISGLVIAPAAFHLLPDQYQRGLARRIAFVNGWLPTDTPAPTREYTSDVLPTANTVNASAALALLASPSPTAAPKATKTNSTATRGTVLSPTAAPIMAMTLASTSTEITQTPAAIDASDTTQSPTKAPTAADTPADASLPTQFALTGFTVVPQGWNDCGPANLTQVLKGYGLNTTQDKIAAWVKPNYNSKNVSPWQLVAYVNQFTSYKALSRVNGNLTLLKKLLVAQFRFIIETGFTIPNNPSEGWMGHYLTPVGYDDGKALFYGFDSYLGDGTNHQGRPENADDLDSRWQQFNRVYIVVYPPDREAELSVILGNDADLAQNAQGAVDQAKHEASYNATNPYAWFNLGSSYVLLQNYKDAATAYDQARNVGGGLPWRMLWYQFGPFAAYSHIGDYKTTQQLIDATLGTTHFIEEPYYWRGMIEAAQNKQQSAIADLSTALKFNPFNHFVSDALNATKSGATLTTPDMP